MQRMQKSAMKSDRQPEEEPVDTTTRLEDGAGAAEHAA